MKQTDQTLLEQLRITEFEIESRQRLFMITDRDIKLIVDAGKAIEAGLGGIVDTFYEMQTNTPEIALLIGDADTLMRLRNAQQRYITDLFSGVYDIEYVNNRLRIGLVHKRIGVDTKLYLSAVYTLKSLIGDHLSRKISDPEVRADTLRALEKVFMFDITLVFETYIRSLLSEIETSREKSEEYARILEDKVRERTHQLEQMARTDPLTSLQSVRYLNETLTRYLRMAESRQETLSLIYIDINDFKQFNDTEGHQRGDEILRTVGNAITQVSRTEDACFRYGGDEFCIILPRCSAEQAHDICVTRLVEALAQEDNAIRLSIGVAQAGPDLFPSAGRLLGEADRAMYRNKAMLKGEGDMDRRQADGEAVMVRLISGGEKGSQA